MEIVVRQKSGLGNQLFQYAAGWYYAKRYGAQMRIAVDLEQRAASHGYPRPFLLPKFSISSPHKELTLWECRMVSENPRLMSAISRVGRAFGAQTITEPSFQYHTFLQDLPMRTNVRTLYLIGYWQVFQIAEAIAGDLRREFSFREPAQGRNLVMLERIRQCDQSVSLHIRRGDYTLPEEGCKALPMSYYQRGIRLFKERLVNPIFFIFSDDIAYAKANLPRDIKAVFVTGNDDFSAHEDLRLMSSCRHHIIANSSFSWWGAWLNPRPYKMVFAPKLWYLRAHTYYPDLLPPNWILDDLKRESIRDTNYGCLTGMPVYSVPEQFNQERYDINVAP